MNDGYKRIFWGIFFITFHINIGIQILPVFIGLLIVVNGISKLEIEFHTNKFKQASNFAFIAAFLSFTGSALGQFGDHVFNASILQFFMLTGFSILELLMEYRILDGSIEYMILCNDLKKADIYTNVTKKYIIFFMIYISLQCIFLTIASDNVLLINSLFAIFLRIWFMQIMSSLKNLDWNKTNSISST